MLPEAFAGSIFSPRAPGIEASSPVAQEFSTATLLPGPAMMKRLAGPAKVKTDFVICMSAVALLSRIVPALLSERLMS